MFNDGHKKNGELLDARNTIHDAETSDLIREGNRYINPSLQEQWKHTVEKGVHGLFDGKDLEIFTQVLGSVEADKKEFKDLKEKGFFKEDKINDAKVYFMNKIVNGVERIYASNSNNGYGRNIDEHVNFLIEEYIPEGKTIVEILKSRKTKKGEKKDTFAERPENPERRGKLW